MSQVFFLTYNPKWKRYFEHYDQNLLKLVDAYNIRYKIGSVIYKKRVK